MTIKSLLQEYNLEIDDVRWYLSKRMCEKIFSFGHDSLALSKFIWSGSLSDELYNMEENFLKDLQDQFDEKTLDESHARDLFKEIEISRKKRFGF